MRKRWSANELTNAIPLVSSVEELASHFGVSVKSIYSRAHIEGCSLQAAFFVKQTVEEKKQRQAQWYQENREWQDNRVTEWRQAERSRLIKEFGGVCNHCGYDDPICLDFDHINNDGYLDKKANIIFHVKKNPTRFQLLCKNCNWRKEFLRRKDAVKDKTPSRSHESRLT